MRQRITLLEPERKELFYEFPDNYEVEMDKKGKVKNWIARQLFALLGKVAYTKRKSRTDEKIQYNEASIDEQEIVEGLFKHIQNVEEVTYGRPDRIVMGPRQLDLMDNEIITQPFSFTIQSPLRAYYQNERVEFAGIQAQVVPWIDGIFVLPEVR